MTDQSPTLQEVRNPERCKFTWKKFPLTVEPIIFVIFFLFSLTGMKREKFLYIKLIFYVFINKFINIIK